MGLRALAWAMVLLSLPGVIALLATLYGVWETTHGRSTWEEVGRVALVAAGFLVPAQVMDRIGRRVSGLGAPWWQEDKLPPRTPSRAAPAPSTRGRQGVPDADGFGAFATTALKQMVHSLRLGTDVPGTDAMLTGYLQTEGIDWHAVWKEARFRTAGVPDFGDDSYWAPIGPNGSVAPVSVLAFCGASLRRAWAADAATSGDLLMRLSRDPDHRIRAAARR